MRILSARPHEEVHEGHIQIYYQMSTYLILSLIFCGISTSFASIRLFRLGGGWSTNGYASISLPPPEGSERG